jgi:hypothetical protein
MSDDPAATSKADRKMNAKTTTMAPSFPAMSFRMIRA